MPAILLQVEGLIFQKSLVYGSSFIKKDIFIEYVPNELLLYDYEQ